MAGDADGRGRGDSYDRIAEDLRRLRLESGEVSYAEIARRIAQRRARSGASPEAARVARTTVYDAFRAGRARINARLVGEIVRALGADATTARQWERRCVRVRLVAEGSPAAEVDRARPEAVPGAAPGDGLSPHGDPGSASPATSPSAPEPREEREREDAVVPAPLGRRRAGAVAALALACLAINFAGYAAVEFLRLPLYLDSVGTGLAAIVLGPWWGVLVGVSMNVLGYSIHGAMALPFALQSAAFGLVWGYGARRFGMTRSPSKFFSLSVWAGLSHLVVSLPILLFIFGGGTGHAGDVVYRHLVALGVPLSVAVLMAQILLSVADAVLVGVAIMVLTGWLRTTRQFADQCVDYFPFYDEADGASGVVHRTRGLLARVHRRPLTAAGR